MDRPLRRDSFAPINPDIGLKVLDEHLLEERLEEPIFYEDQSPQHAQHCMSALSIHEDHEFEKVQHHKERTKVIDSHELSPDYLYYHLSKSGEDWSRAIKDTISAPVEHIEKKIRVKGSDGTVLEQRARMSTLRRNQILNAIDGANDREVGNTHWQVVYIKAKKVISGKKAKTVVVPEMDIILAKTKEPVETTPEI
ncbi:hypothetical protein LTR84_000560 [Exophiala bonariae]|uniref:Uncharacterized protein n=1 Tax=Exophiala bonariae TaxID=1690606 RepID=A0AAV9NS04_9EURO|nr:hypothetical protein LTR84_000560 [Exophiala bonariae]